MNTATSKTSEEALIRQVMDNWVTALKAKDIDRMMSNYTPDVLVFGVTPPLQYDGATEYRKKWEEMFNSMEGPIGYESRDLTITTGSDLAFSRCLNRISARIKGGKESDELPWMRVTLCFKKIDGKWLVTHEHASVPFYVESGKSSLDLEP